jgi:hypothetical protein
MQTYTQTHTHTKKKRKKKERFKIMNKTDLKHKTNFSLQGDEYI